MVTTSELRHLENRIRMMEDRLIRAKTTAEIEQIQLVIRVLRSTLVKERRTFCYGN